MHVDDDELNDETREVVDDRLFPLVWTTFPRHVTLAFVDRYFSMLRRQYERGPFVLVCDIRSLKTSTATAPVRAAFFNASDRFERDMGVANYLGEAVIVGSTLQRALLSAYTWFIAGAPYPTRVFRHEDEARAWCEACIAKAALTPGGASSSPRAAARD